MRAVLARTYRLTRLAASGPGAPVALVLYAVVLGLQFAAVWVSVQLIDWQKAFYDALEQRDAAQALIQVGHFALLISASAACFITSDWLRKRLQMRLRERLTACVLDAWLANKAYWHLRPGFSAQPVDNPDQRIAEDCRKFIERLLIETLDVISNLVALVSYVAVLWSLSAVPLSFTLFGVDVEIARYMVWAAFLYVAVSSLMTHLLGRPVKGLVFQQERREADFRHALVQLREGTDEIAQSSGEEAERRRLERRFGEVRCNWHRLIRAEVILGLFVRPYVQTILRIPTFLALPVYFAGNLTLGGLMQLAQAFSTTATTLSWFIFSYRDLAEFVAVSERLDGLLALARHPQTLEGVPQAVTWGPAPGGGLALRGVALSTPQGMRLAPVPDVALRPGQCLWVAGPSGVGKSTLLAALSGLWPFGEGRISMPDGPRLVLPQAPRVFPEGLAHAASYPLEPEEVGREAIEAALREVGLGHKLAALDLPGAEGFAGLSMGERQRLALARVFIHRPAVLILDEATSALDARSEVDLLARLRAALPGATIICAAHRPPEALGDYVTLHLTAPDAYTRPEPELSATGALA
ncbi:ABC transporter ATP-binding protein/permease [Pannonibacter phragmitetus]|uniref:ABC transporter ATP-binding protein/permease n=1 Tax=Pannonibacter phragmitetus TaxID=121719 RepID=UPI003D2EB7E0